MAVIYSKLGGCLGVTAKLGPFSQNRPLRWCQRFVGKVNDPLRVRFFIGRTLAGPVGGCEGGGAFPGGCTGLRGRLSGLKPGGKPSTLPVCLRGVGIVPCLGCPVGVIGGLGRIIFFPCGAGPGLRGVRGRAVSF